MDKDLEYDGKNGVYIRRDTGKAQASQYAQAEKDRMAYLKKQKEVRDLVDSTRHDSASGNRGSGYTNNPKHQK